MAGSRADIPQPKKVIMDLWGQTLWIGVVSSDIAKRLGFSKRDADEAGVIKLKDGRRLHVPAWDTRETER